MVRECKSDVLNYLEKRRKEKKVESIKDLLPKDSNAEVGFGFLSGDFYDVGMAIFAC